MQDYRRIHIIVSSAKRIRMFLQTITNITFVKALCFRFRTNSRFSKRIRTFCLLESLCPYEQVDMYLNLIWAIWFVYWLFSSHFEVWPHDLVFGAYFRVSHRLILKSYRGRWGYLATGVSGPLLLLILWKGTVVI